MSNLKAELLERKRNLMGEDANTELQIETPLGPVVLTCRAMVMKNVLEVGGELLSIFGKINAASANEELQSSMDVLGMLRPYVLGGVIDPPLDSDAGPDSLTPEDLGLENWEVIVRKVMALSGMNLMFRGSAAAKSLATPAV